MSEFIPEDLFVDDPVFTVRWRLQNRALPLKSRLLRAFAASGVSNGLASWARQHIEWTLAEGTAKEPNGVLVLSMDDQGRAMMAAEPYESLAPHTAAELLERTAHEAAQPLEGEVVWVARNGGAALVALTDASKPLSGVNSLIVDLAKTLGISVSFESRENAEALVTALGADDEVFLASDEHGVVPASDCGGATAERFVAYYGRLVGQAKPDDYDRMNLGIF